MRELNIGGLIIKNPIVQGGMGVGISLSGLASAVANEGGVGVIAPVGLGLIYNDKSKDYRENSIYGLKEEIRMAREKSSGTIGVNIMVALTNYADMVKTSIQEGIDIIFSGAGLPLDLPKYLIAGSKTKLVPIVSSARAVKIICQKWKTLYNYLPDAIVVEGPKAGGHLGFKQNQIDDEKFSLENILPEVVDAVNEIEKEEGKHIPVIAAGGIYTGEDIVKIMEKGAEGVQMGTRFVITHECDASEGFKNAYINADKNDVRIIKSPVGMPGRAIGSQFLEEVESGQRKPKNCPVNCIKTCDVEKAPYCIIASLISALRGNFRNGYAFAGSNVWKTDKIISVKELFSNIKREFNQYVNR
jgi:NAD(P)H-dependent flavin oxidoreductase YrpB (nitropropane dioxygenase family)